MKLRNWIAVIIIMVVVTVGGIVFGQIQSARADDLRGTTDNVTSANVTLGGKTLVIDANTKIIGDLVPGSSISIKAQVQADGTILATMIKVNNNNGHDGAVSGNCTKKNEGPNGVSGNNTMGNMWNFWNNHKEQSGASGNNTAVNPGNIQNNMLNMWKNGQWHLDKGWHFGNMKQSVR
jgi:hypothetical protein